MEKDIGKIQKSEETEIVVRVDDFGGKKGVTIREFVKGERYTGFTKSGTKIPAEKFAEFKELINKVDLKDLELEVEREKVEEEVKKEIEKAEEKAEVKVEEIAKVEEVEKKEKKKRGRKKKLAVEEKPVEVKEIVEEVEEAKVES